MYSSSTLKSVTDHGWRSGFANMLRSEMSLWWRTRKWWVQSLIWLGVVNGILALILWADPTSTPSATEALEPLIMIHGSFSAIGVIILAQGIIVGEKRSGTAEWILSNPVSRSAFMLSKLVGNALGILVIVVLLQGLVGFAQVSFSTGSLLPPLPILAGMALLGLHCLFYLCLALMLGAIFGARGPVIGISIAVLVGQNLAAQLLARWVPWLPSAIPEGLLRVAVPVARGHTLPSDWPVPIAVASIMSLCFVIVSIWRFQREEF